MVGVSLSFIICIGPGACVCQPGDAHNHSCLELEQTFFLVLFSPCSAFHPLQEYPGCWFLVYNLILPQIEDLCKQKYDTASVRSPLRKGNQDIQLQILFAIV